MIKQLSCAVEHLESIKLLVEQGFGLLREVRFSLYDIQEGLRISFSISGKESMISLAWRLISGSVLGECWISLISSKAFLSVSLT